jgi:NAD(P) transhydrogenase subunit beta
MPVLHVWNADHVVVFKRSMASGYAGVPNPLFYRENTSMLFGDAKSRVDAIVAALN